MEQIIKILKIENCGCVGDCLHNSMIDLLTTDIDDSQLNIELIDTIAKLYDKWIFNTWTKEEIRRLNVIMKTKRQNTLNKRILSFYEYLNRGSFYSQLFNNKKYEAVENVLSKYIKQ